MDKVMKQIYFPREEVIDLILRYNRHERDFLETLSDSDLCKIKELFLNPEIEYFDK